MTRFVVDRLNQETPAIAVDLNDAVQAMRSRDRPTEPTARTGSFDRHGGVGETLTALYLFPSLVQLDKAVPATLTLPPHLTKMLPDVVKGDPAATTVFLAEGLKPKDTGKGTSASEMSTTGVWSERDPKEATAEQGRRATESA